MTEKECIDFVFKVKRIFWVVETEPEEKESAFRELYDLVHENFDFIKNSMYKCTDGKDFKCRVEGKFVNKK